MSTRISVSVHAAEEVFGLTVTDAHARYTRLTRRERQVAALLADGRPNREIASELGICVKTIDIHRSSVKIKLHASTVSQVANVVNLVRIAEAAPAPCMECI